MAGESLAIKQQRAKLVSPGKNVGGSLMPVNAKLEPMERDEAVRDEGGHQWK